MIDGLYLLFKSIYSVATLTEIYNGKGKRRKGIRISFENAASGFFWADPPRSLSPNSQRTANSKRFYGAVCSHFGSNT